MPLTEPLVSLLGETPDAKRAVANALCGDGAKTHADLLSDVFALASELSDDAGRRWLVETEDAYRIAVALLAAAVRGARIALPPNLQPGTLADLRSSCDRVFVTDDTGAEAGAIDPLAPGRLSRGTAPLRVSIDRSIALVDLYTSGTSGPGKLVTKALCHLEDEVVCLERELGADLGPDAHVVATVSAHHLYGLLFRVLWPLAAGRPFGRTSFLLPDELLARVGEAQAGDARHALVVSSPAHLRHLAASPRLGDQAARIRAIFSSGGPLEAPTALELEAATGIAAVEIFGSTETGGVAWRRTCKADPAPRWTLLRPVTIAIGDDETLIVTSPFVTSPAANHELSASPPVQPQTWTMGDRVAIDGSGFRLLGRSDRIAKVGEKTLSLPEIEARLAGHRYVEAAVLGTYRAKSGERLGALVVLGREGRLCLAQSGKRALQSTLAAHIAERWNRLAVPRRWRFLERMPADARGKIARDAFEREIARPAEEQRDPLVLDEQRGGDEIILELVVPRDLAYLDGHYEAFALVPGAVQIQWVLWALGRSFGRTASAQRMEAIKFKNVLRPGQVFTMSLRPNAGRVAFTLADPERVYSSGRITLFA